MSVIPRLTRTAGFELGSGMFINTVIPDDAAEFLRKVQVETAVGVGRYASSGPSSQCGRNHAGRSANFVKIWLGAGGVSWPRSNARLDRLCALFENHSRRGGQYLYSVHFFGRGRTALAKISAESPQNPSIGPFDRHTPRPNKAKRQR
jgi:hypothetical protein